MTLEADGATDRPVCSVTRGLTVGGDRPLNDPAEINSVCETKTYF